VDDTYRRSVVAVDDEVAVEGGFHAFGCQGFLLVNHQGPKWHRQVMGIDELFAFELQRRYRSYPFRSACSKNKKGTALFLIIGSSFECPKFHLL